MKSREIDTEDLIKRSGEVALASFVLGTCLFLLFFFTNADAFSFASIPIIIILAVANFILVARHITTALREKKGRDRILRTAALSLLNIPVALLYIHLVFLLYDSFVVRFENETGRTLTNISVIGCDKRMIDELQPGESEIEWIPLTADCIERPITIEYKIDTVTHREVVVGYVLSGSRVNHSIGNE